MFTSSSANASNPAALLIKCPIDVDDMNDYLNHTNNQSYKIRLRMNRVDNASFNMTQAEILFDEINSAFSELSVTFYWDCIIYDVINTVDSKNAIDINIKSGTSADTPQMPGTEVAVGTQRTNQVIIHEIGHALGLLHTHHSDNHFNTAPGDDTCEEFVIPDENDINEVNNGFKCGDCIKSTPAATDVPNYQIEYDPISNTCTYTPEEGANGEIVMDARDSHGDVYVPHIENYMSYEVSYNGTQNTIDDIDCRSKFVTEQGNRMRNILENSSILKEVRIYDNFSDVDFSSNTFSEGINFGSNIHIDQPLILPDGAEIAMFGNHRIFIEQGGFIEGNNIKIVGYSGTSDSPCDEGWKGIKIHGQTVQDITTGIKLTGNSTVINAKTGISQQYGNFNGYMELVGTTFLDCERGIELMKSDNDQSIIENCKFINGKYGITAWANDFTAKSCTFNNIYERGIYGIASSPTINNENNVTGAHFENCNIGILLAFPSGQTSQTTIENNYFLQNFNAIILESGAGVSNADRSIIRQNRFDVNWVGVKVSGANFYELSNNEFDISFYGNYVVAAGSDPNEIFLNNYNDALVGPLFTVDNSNTNIERNCFSNHTFFDMFVDGIFADQGSDITPANGNCFSKTNPEIGTSEVGPGFNYYQLAENISTVDDCIFVESEGNFTILDSDESKLSDDCGNTYFPTPNGFSQGHSPCNPNKNESDIAQAIDYLISLIEEIENSTILDEETKENLIEYYERCLRKNKLLLVSLFLEENRIDEAVDLFRNEEEFDMQIKGYSILVDKNRLTESETFLDRLIASSEEEQDFIFAQGLYLDALMDENYIPTNNDLDKLFDNGHKNTVLAGFSRSIYLFFTDELIEIPIEFEELPNIDPRSPQNGRNGQNENYITIYPNPFQGNTVSVDYQSSDDNKSTYVLTSIEGNILASGILQNGTHQIEIKSQITGLLFLQITDNIGNVEIHKLVKTR